MLIKLFNRYRLVHKDVPEIINKKTIVKDVNVGGIKLSYKVSTVKALVFNFLNKQRIITLFVVPNTTRNCTVLNPYKTFWNNKERPKKLPKSLWGNTDRPLTNIWVELECDYKDLNSGKVLIKEEIRNTNITKHFSKQHPCFYIETKDNNQ